MNEIVYTLAPGVYEDLPAEQYHALHLASTHALNVLAEQSPMHLAYERANPTAQTPALVIGSALHTIVLEPKLFESQHPVAGQCEAVTGKGDRCKNPGKKLAGTLWFCGQHAKADAVAPVGLLTDAEAQQVAAMSDAIRAQPAAAQILAAVGPNEVSVVWDTDVWLSAEHGEPYPLRCKLRADMVRPCWQTIGDIKTTDDASPAGFARSVAKYGYHRQAAHYIDGFAAHGIRIEHFVFIVVEKTAPYAVAAYRLSEDSVALGRDELGVLRRTYAACERAGRWPGFSDEFQDISLPAWKAKQIATAL